MERNVHLNVLVFVYAMTSLFSFVKIELISDLNITHLRFNLRPAGLIFYQLNDKIFIF